jgi:hypothetical protein
MGGKEMKKSKFQVNDYGPKQLSKEGQLATVGDLIAVLQKLPAHMPIESHCEPVCLQWFNVGFDDEHIGIEDAGIWCDDDIDDCEGE